MRPSFPSARVSRFRLLTLASLPPRRTDATGENTVVFPLRSAAQLRQCAPVNSQRDRLGELSSRLQGTLLAPLLGKPSAHAHSLQYLESVNRLLYTFVEDFGIHRIATYLSDLHFTYVAFTAVSLIHVRHPNLSHLLAATDTAVLSQAITIGFGCRPAEASSAVRLVKRVANLFESSAGTVRHNLRSQAHFLRAVLHAKLDESGQPRAKAPSLEDWTLTVAGLDSAFLDALGPAAAPDANAEAATLLNTAAGPAAVDFDSLNATLNSSQVLSNKDFDTAYWCVSLHLVWRPSLMSLPRQVCHARAQPRQLVGRS